MCRRIFRCICNFKADKASLLHRNDCEVVEGQECRHGRSRSTTTRLQKLEVTPSSQLSTGLRRPWIFARWSCHGEWCLRRPPRRERNPRTCRGADDGLPCFPLKEELVEVAEEVEILVPQERAQQWTVDRAPVPQFLDETVELRLVPQERVQ